MESQLIVGELCKTPQPVLSILIPTYGRAQYLEEAIDSAINQKKHNISYEIIVVSNDPEDRLERIVNKYSHIDFFYLYRNTENIGMVNNSNRCAKLARGKYIAYLHDDDYLYDNYLQTVETYFFNKVSGKTKCFIPAREILFEDNRIEYRHAVCKHFLRKIFFIPSIYRRKIRKIQLKDNLYANMNCYFAPSCGTLIEKAAFEQVGGFDSNIAYSWDYDFFLRFNLMYDIVVCSVPSAVYRIAQNASLRSEVKYDFYEFNRRGYLDFMKKCCVGLRFIKFFEREIVYSVYQQWEKELYVELSKRNEAPPYIKHKWKWYLFKIITLLYYYTNNLDVQRLLLK